MNWSNVFYNRCDIWRGGNVGATKELYKKKIEALEMWTSRRMHYSCTQNMRNEEVLRRVEDEKY